MTALLDLLRRRQAPPATPAEAEPDPDGTDDPAPEPVGVEVEFAAYAEDCRVFGFVRLTGDRMSDLLNERDEYTLTDVMVVRLETGVPTQLRYLTIRREEVLAVRAAGPRGNPARRSRRRPSPVTLSTGPYRIHGYVHAVPGADPIQDVRRRRPMVPLTEAWIEYPSLGQQHRARVGTVIVNREQWDWVRLSRDEEVRLPGLPAESKPDPMAKDLTGYIRFEAD